MHLILIPESLNRTPSQSLLYRKVRAFLAEEQLEDQFAVAVLKFRGGMEVTEGTEVRKRRKAVKFVPNNTRKSWVPEAQIQRMARRYAEYLGEYDKQFEEKIVFARGAYLQAMRKASVIAGVPIQEVLSEADLMKLRRKGMAWMKVGLRLKDAWVKLEETVREVAGRDRLRVQKGQKVQKCGHQNRVTSVPFVPSACSYKKIAKEYLACVRAIAKKAGRPELYEAIKSIDAQAKEACSLAGAT